LIALAIVLREVGVRDVIREVIFDLGGGSALGYAPNFIAG